MEDTTTANPLDALSDAACSLLRAEPPATSPIPLLTRQSITSTTIDIGATTCNMTLDLSSLSEIASSLPRQPVPTPTSGNDSTTVSNGVSSVGTTTSPASGPGTNTKPRRLSSAGQARRRLSDATTAVVTQAVVSRVTGGNGTCPGSTGLLNANYTNAPLYPTTTSPDRNSGLSAAVILATTATGPSASSHTTTPTPKSNVPSNLARSMPTPPNINDSNHANLQHLGSNVTLLVPAPAVHHQKKKGQVFKCEICSKVYRHPSCLVKHRWEHSSYWREASKFSLSKHQQVQLLEAAAILSHITPPSIPSSSSDSGLSSKSDNTTSTGTSSSVSSATSTAATTAALATAESLGLTEEEAQRMSSSLGTSLPEDRSLWPYFVSGGALPLPRSVPYRSYENGYTGVSSSANGRRRGSSVSAGSESVVVDVEGDEFGDEEGESESVVLIEEAEEEGEGEMSDGEVVKEEGEDSGYGSGSGSGKNEKSGSKAQLTVPVAEEPVGMMTRARSKSTSSSSQLQARSHGHARSTSVGSNSGVGKAVPSTRYSLRHAHASSYGARKHMRSSSHSQSSNSGNHGHSYGHEPSRSLPSSNIFPDSTSPKTAGTSPTRNPSATRPLPLVSHTSTPSDLVAVPTSASVTSSTTISTVRSQYPHNYSHPITVPSIMPKLSQAFAIISSSATPPSLSTVASRAGGLASPISIPSSAIRGVGGGRYNIGDMMEVEEEVVECGGEKGNREDDEETVDGELDLDVDVEGEGENEDGVRWDEGMDMDMDMDV